MRKIYTYEECKHFASEYQTRKELKEAHPEIYNKINKEKWGKELFKHMKRLDHREIEYTREFCTSIIKNYTTLKEFREKNNKLYSVILYHKWGDLFQNLEKTGSAVSRTIYAYEFPEYNTAYIGLTYNIVIRNKDHHIRGSLYKWAKQHNISKYAPKILEQDVKFDKAGDIEDFYIRKYEQDGWILINKAKAGSLGGMILKNDDIVIFTEEGNFVDCGKIEEISKKYNIKISLIRICLRKRNKTTNRFQILYKSEWEKNGSPIKISPKIDPSKTKKIAILKKDFTLEHVCESKSEARKYLSLTSSLNCVTFIRKNLICNYGIHADKWVCYYDDYKKYENGESIIVNPHIPKDKKHVFLPKSCTKSEKDEIIKTCFERKAWKENSLKRKKNKNVVEK